MNIRIHWLYSIGFSLKQFDHHYPLNLILKDNLSLLTFVLMDALSIIEKTKGIFRVTFGLCRQSSHHLKDNLMQFSLMLQTVWKIIHIPDTLKDKLKPYFGNVILFSRLPLESVISSILNLYLCSFIECFQWIFFSLIKEMNRLQVIQLKN